MTPMAIFLSVMRAPPSEVARRLQVIDMAKYRVQDALG